MLNIAWVQFIFDCLKSIYGLSRKGKNKLISLWAICITLVLTTLCYGFVMSHKNLEGKMYVKEEDIERSMRAKVRKAGDNSAITEYILYKKHGNDAHKTLEFSKIIACDHRLEYLFRGKKTCDFSIKYHRTAYNIPYELSNKDELSIGKDMLLLGKEPNEKIIFFSEKSVFHLKITDKDGALTKQAGEFFDKIPIARKIFKQVNLKEFEAYFIKVKDYNEDVIYIYSLTFWINPYNGSKPEKNNMKYGEGIRDLKELAAQRKKTMPNIYDIRKIMNNK